MGKDMTDFERDLIVLINKYSKEDESSTPDFMLASFLEMCLKAFSRTVKKRDTWYKVTHVLPKQPHMGCAVEEVACVNKPVAHVVGEVIVGTSPIGAEYLCHGKCEYSPGLIRLDEIKIHSQSGILLGVSNEEGGISDATEDKSGVFGMVSADGTYVLNLAHYKGLSCKISYDYEYDLPVEDK